MRSFILKCCFFGGSVLLIYPLFIWVWCRVMPPQIKSNVVNKGFTGHMEKRLHEAREVVRPDLLFLGSSHAYRSFDPRLFKESGYSTFNLGSSAQNPVVTNWLLKRYLKRIRPKNIVYVVDNEEIGLNTLQSGLDILQQDSFGLDMISLAMDCNHIKTYNTCLFRIVDYILPVEKFRFESRKNEVYVPGGYVSYKQNKEKTPLPALDRSDPVKVPNLEWFKKNIELIRNSGIPYVLVTTPYTRQYVQSNPYFNMPFSEYGRYRNFNDMPELQQGDYFFDAHHLNALGVKEFNARFIEWLHSIGLNPGNFQG